MSLQVGDRETSLDKTHTIAQYTINTLHKNKIIPDSNMNNLIGSIVCSTVLYPTRNDLDSVSWHQWIRRQAGKTVKITKFYKE